MKTSTAENTTEIEEIEVMEIINGNETDFRTETNTKQLMQHTENKTVMIRRYRAVSVCSMVLCGVLLSAVIIMSVQFAKNNKNITEERDQLQTRIHELYQQSELLSREKKDLGMCFNEQEGWKNYNFSCYFISSGGKAWSESRRYCKERGAHMIIIDNKEEQDFIFKAFQTPFWIGLSDTEEEGTWKWVDNSTLTYSVWGSGQPNSYGGEEDCALFEPSGWSDYPCKSKFKFICERRFL